MAKLSMNSDELKQMLDAVSPAVQSGIDGTPGIILTVKEGGEWVCAEAHNYEVSILTEDFQLDKDKSEDGEIPVPADWVLNAKNKLPKDTVSVELSDTSVILKSGRFRTVAEKSDPMRTLNFTESAQGDHISIDRKSFAKGLEVAYTSMPKNDYRAILNGVNIELKNDSLVFTSTNGHKASRYICNEYDTKMESMSVIVPFKSVSYLIKMLKSCDITEDVDLYVKQNNMHLITGEGNHLVTVFVYGQFPNCSPIFNYDDNVKRNNLIINKKELLDAFDRVKSVGKDKKMVTVRMESEPGSKILNLILFEGFSITQRKSNDEIDIEREEGSDGEIAIRFNPQYVSEVLGSSSAEEILFRIANSDEKSHSIIEFKDDEFVTCTLMGMHD